MAVDETRTLRLLITGGGTGGHLFPAVAAAQALRKRVPQSEVLFIGTRRKMDSTTLQSYGFSSTSIISHGLKGKNIAELCKALAILPVSVLQAARILRQFKPDVTLGVGGYVTGPVMLAARLLGVPTVIHEQNSVPGMANRKLGRLVDKVCLSLPGSERHFPAEKVVMTGNPVRDAILELAGEHLAVGEREKLTMLVLGGSQGAHALNKLVTETLCDQNLASLAGLKVIHQTGQTDAQWVEEKYRAKGIDARVAPFFRDMNAVYREADFLVSRAGATTLTELAILGKPALLVPYPYAADDHQQKNAEYYLQGGGVRCVPERELDAAVLADTLTTFMEDRDTLSRMSDAMRAMAMPLAAERIVDVCLELTGMKDKSETMMAEGQVE